MNEIVSQRQHNGQWAVTLNGGDPAYLEFGEAVEYIKYLGVEFDPTYVRWKW